MPSLRRSGSTSTIHPSRAIITLKCSGLCSWSAGLNPSLDIQPFSSLGDEEIVLVENCSVQFEDLEIMRASLSSPSGPKLQCIIHRELSKIRIENHWPILTLSSPSGLKLQCIIHRELSKIRIENHWPILALSSPSGLELQCKSKEGICG